MKRTIDFRARAACLAMACVGSALLFAAGPAAALVIEPPVYSGTTITGPTEVGAPAFGAELPKLGIDQQSDNLYASSGAGRFYKFDLTTNQSAPFSALGKSTITTGPYMSQCCGDLSVDNSNTSTQGRIYAMEEQTYMRAFLPTGDEENAFDPTSGSTGICGAATAPDGHYWVNRFENSLAELDPLTGAPTGKTLTVNGNGGLAHDGCEFRIDSENNFYVSTHWQVSDHPVILKFSSTGQFEYSLGNGAVAGLAIDPSNDAVYIDEQSSVEMYSSSGSLLATFGDKAEGNVNGGEPYTGISGSRGIAVDEETHYVYVYNAKTGGIDIFKPGPAITAPDVTTTKAVPTPTTATLLGTVNPSSVNTTKCFFQWGETTSYGKKPGEVGGEVACDQGNELDGSADIAVSAQITGLSKGVTYNFRLIAENSTGAKINGANRSFRGQGKPTIVSQFIDGVKGDVVRLNADIDPEEGDTTYHFEYGTTTGYGLVVPVPEGALSSHKGVQAASELTHNLALDTEYHYRVVATNDAGVTLGADRTFHTYPPFNNVDPCSNALARQQTGAVLLGRCRAYELVSASNSGGYNVESDLVPGQNPLDGFPNAEDKVLYGVSDGGIPNTGSPTNKGLDPYIATRDGDTGWSTRYVGIPADGTPSTAPFSSTFLGADQDLETLAFSGSQICSPCFDDGSAGIPLRLPNGDLVQGMKGAIPQPEAVAAGLVRQPFADDGSHFVFGADRKFELAGNEGSVSIYDRDLGTDTTQVVSTLPNGDTMGGEVGELAISSDGERIAVGEEISTDSAGNVYWHLYMHRGTSPNSVDLTPTTTTGALYAGMSSDGSKIFFSTKDQLLPGVDTDDSADVYEADIGDSGPVTLSLVSRSGAAPHNDDSCTPSGTIPWNKVSGGPDCSAVAFAGGAGVAADGTIYFLSPEVLDGAAVANQVNAYVLRPGDQPHFVATIDTSIGKPLQSPPLRPVNQSFLTGLSNPQSLAVDESNGDIYVTESGSGRVARYTSSGAPDDFPNPGGSNRITGLNLGGDGESEIAVDNAAASPFHGALYVRQNANTISVYASSGEKLGSISGFNEACGLALDESTGVLYVGDYSYGGIRRLAPVSATTPVSKANYTETGIKTEGVNPCQVAADTAGHVYASRWSSGPLTAYSASEFAAVPPTVAGKPVTSSSYAMYTDGGTNDIYVTAATGGIRIFDENGVLKENLLPGSFPGARGVAVNAENHKVYVSTGVSVVEIGYVEVPYTPIDNPAATHAVHQSGVLDHSDIQLTPDGRFAAFSTALPLTGFDSNRKLEVFRYDSDDGSIDCVSCAASGSRPPGDSTLSSQGLSLTDDGRVFFTSAESLVLRDTDERKDAYEWSENPGSGGEARLISSGSSPFDSGLLSASADGHDVYFFTRDSFVDSDHNGTLMKIYDAREGGGFFHVPPPPPCAASDECHGAGSEAAPPSTVSSLAGTPGNATPERCRKGFVRKRGKCVRKKPKRNQKRHGKRRNG